MQVFTKWVSYGGSVGITEKGDYYELTTGKIMKREVHVGALYYRSVSGKKRYSWKKCNETKVIKRVEIIEIPF